VFVVAHGTVFFTLRMNENNMLYEFKSHSRRCVLALLVVTLALLAGCASAPQWNEEQRALLEQRVRERWQALESRDFEKAWEYTSPHYRAIFSKQLYVRNFSYAVDWELTGVEIVNYDADAAVASVVVRVMSKPTKQTSVASVVVGATHSILSERWIFTEGQWWFSAKF